MNTFAPRITKLKANIFIHYSKWKLQRNFLIKRLGSQFFTRDFSSTYSYQQSDALTKILPKTAESAKQHQQQLQGVIPTTAAVAEAVGNVAGSKAGGLSTN